MLLRTMTEALNDLLKATSRSFYLTLRVLPARVRPQIGLAYLLARTTDTVADTEIVPLAQRLDALQKLRERILGQSSATLNFGELAKQQNLSAEKLLLEKVEASLSALQNLSEADQKLIRFVLDTITSGQELDLRRFGKFSAGARVSSPAASPNNLSSAAAGDSRAPNIVALETAAELDDYTFRVAGCVGEFWTKICRAHLFPDTKLDEIQFIADGIRFGKGLQMVNILRDLPNDLRNGRCYLPKDKLVEAGLSPEDLLSPTNEARFRPLYNSYLDLAESHLAAGWKYTNSIPRGQIRVRLACAWPVLIGAKTISRLREGGILDPQKRIKITRAEVRGILLRSVAGYPFGGVWKKLFVTGRKAVASEAKLT
jgi:farnesyl-diphosphate farnesyltransferase